MRRDEAAERSQSMMQSVMKRDDSGRSACTQRRGVRANSTTRGEEHTPHELRTSQTHTTNTERIRQHQSVEQTREPRTNHRHVTLSDGCVAARVRSSALVTVLCLTRFHAACDDRDESDGAPHDDDASCCWCDGSLHACSIAAVGALRGGRGGVACCVPCSSPPTQERTRFSEDGIACDGSTTAAAAGTPCSIRIGRCCGGAWSAPHCSPPWRTPLASVQVEQRGERGLCCCSACRCALRWPCSSARRG